MIYCQECPIREECRPLKRYFDGIREQGAYVHPLDYNGVPDWNMDACPLYAIMKVSDE